MKSSAIFLCLIFGTACGQLQREVYVYPKTSDDSALASIAADFTADMAANDIPLRAWPRVINFKTLQNGQVGLCQLQDSFSISEVSVAPEIANNPGMLRAVVYHELAHCALLLLHDPEPGHIFSESLSYSTDWEDGWTEKLDYFVEMIQSGQLRSVWEEET